MLLLALCIFCNVLLAIVFKGFARYKVDNINGIILNYFTCVVAASLFMGEFAIPGDVIDQKWFPFAIGMGILFIVGFNILGAAFQKAGVALTVIIVKMSLILPVIFAIALFGESLGALKLIGIVCALSAIVLVNLPNKSLQPNIVQLSGMILLLPILAFLLSGIIEVILFYVQASGVVTDDSLTFVASSFGFAGIFGALYTFYRMYRFKIYPGVKELLGGIALGLPNFLSIYLLLVLLENGWDGSVLFPINNVGILILTSLAGILFYKESVNLRKSIGLILALFAILLIGLGG